MRNKPKKKQKEVQISHLEISYQDGFERDWAKVLAGILMQQIIEKMKQSGVLDD